MKQENEQDLFNRFKSEFCDKDGFVKPVNADAICNWFAWNVWREKVTTQVEHDRFDVDESDIDEEPEPCPTCGEIEGMVNPCCPGFDPLHYKNCGYG
jgi:hypothetical protein